MIDWNDIIFRILEAMPFVAWFINCVLFGFALGVVYWAPIW